MENASKALLIAGAILIAILLIAVGMMIFNGASGIFNQGGRAMSEHERTAFNQKFTIYGEQQNGSTVKALLDTINANNADTDNPQVVVTANDSDLDGGTVTTAPTGSDTAAVAAIKNNIVSARRYMVTFQYFNGLVCSINIKTIK